METKALTSDKEEGCLTTIALTCIQELLGSYLCEDTIYPGEGSAAYRSHFLQDGSRDNTLQRSVIICFYILPCSPSMITRTVAVE
jgi:hypothetical protein